VRFTGGEPLLRGDFTDLYLFARRLGLKVLLFTNARLITPAIAELLVRIPPLVEIEVSVYGMHAPSYEAVTRVPGSYSEFRAGVERLLERKIPFIVKGALLPPNKPDVAEFEDWAASIPWLDHAPSYSMFFDMRVRRDSATRDRLISRLRLAPQEGASFLARDMQSYRRGMAEFCGKFMRAPGERLFACGISHGACADAYGYLLPCMGVRHPDLAYNLKTGSLREALMVEFPKLKERRVTNPQYLNRCARCFLGGLCEQCPGKSWSEHGTLDTPVEYFCQVAHAQAYALGLLVEGEHAWEVTDGAQRVYKLVEGEKL